MTHILLNNTCHGRAWLNTSVRFLWYLSTSRLHHCMINAIETFTSVSYTGVMPVLLVVIHVQCTCAGICSCVILVCVCVYLRNHLQYYTIAVTQSQ